MSNVDGADLDTNADDRYYLLSSTGVVFIGPNENILLDSDEQCAITIGTRRRGALTPQPPSVC